jgi:hypothetical protein
LTLTLLKSKHAPLAWLAEQDDLVEAFDKGEDVYKIMASASMESLKKKLRKMKDLSARRQSLGLDTEWVQLSSGSA